MCRGLEQLWPTWSSVVGDHVSTIGGDMNEAPALPLLERLRKRAPGPGGASVEPVEIFAPDRYCTDLLLECAAPLFRAEIAPGFVWIVRVHPPTGAGWALELLALVQRWLESARLPWATVLYRGRSYLIRPTTDIPAVQDGRGIDRRAVPRSPELRKNDHVRNPAQDLRHSGCRCRGAHADCGRTGRNPLHGHQRRHRPAAEGRRHGDQQHRVGDGHLPPDRRGQGDRSAPVDTFPPTISGTFKEDNTLSVAHGSWTGSPAPTFTYQWQRCDATGGGCVDLTGAKHVLCLPLHAAPVLHVDDVANRGDAADHVLVVVLDDPRVGLPPVVQCVEGSKGGG
jgi:hypothetical protein